MAVIKKEEKKSKKVKKKMARVSEKKGRGYPREGAAIKKMYKKENKNKRRMK